MAIADLDPADVAVGLVPLFTALLAAVFAALLAPAVVAPILAILAPILAVFAPVLALVALFFVPLAVIVASPVVLGIGERPPGGGEQRSPEDGREQEPRQLYAHSLPPTDFRRA
ncbi:MAG TPA: hypothetical protein VLM79_12695 [Kofleriaceae bacterium]|nr:hypothetical protein [Kofleriaceae bacterium]